MIARLPIKPGDVFDRLTIVSEETPRRLPSGQLKRRFVCACACGASTVAMLDNLRRLKTKSCGCGERENRIKHGLHSHPFYFTYLGMLARCEKEPDYFGRGITVCDEWKGEGGLRNFIAWVATQGDIDGLTLDRRDNDAGYSPQNCRFVDQSRQQRNKRSTLIAQRPDDCTSVPLIDLWEAEGHPAVAYTTARNRFKYHGWDALSAVTIPPYSKPSGFNRRRSP